MQDEAGDLCMGMVSTAARLAPLLPDDLRSCPPGEATGLQAVRVVARFMETHLESLQDDFDQLVLMALQKAWPCQ
jgi:hypothetical protein